jgi:DNA-binding NarL/FixJ family response regulator
MAHTCREALVHLAHERIPIVICERQLPDGSWKDMLSQLTPMVDRPRLIVVSRDADEKLWEEVLNMGAFDLLSDTVSGRRACVHYRFRLARLES